MTRHPPAVPVEFEDEFIAGLRDIFEKRIVFNGVLGLKIVELRPDKVIGRIAMRRSWSATSASTGCTAAWSAPGWTRWAAWR